MTLIKPFFILLTVLTVVSCSTSRHVPAEHVNRDSVHIDHIRYDSIFIYKDRYLNRGSDTVHIKDVSIEYRYKLLRDTVYIGQKDSIPYPVTVVETRKVEYIPWWCKILSWTGTVCLIIIVTKRCAKLLK